MTSSESSSAKAIASPLGLRAFHALIFIGFGAASVAGMLTELRQLGEGLFYPWHSGTPPTPIGVAAAITAVLLCLGLVVCLALARSAPLWMSGLLLLCFLGSMFNQSYPFSARSAPGANLAMLEVAKLLHEAMRLKLQKDQRVPTAQAEWERALAGVVGEDPKLQSPFRQRYFSTVPWKIERIAKEGEFLAEGAPGTFTVFVPEDASRFTITMLGLDPQHQVVRLRDDLGEVFQLRGVFAPDTDQ